MYDPTALLELFKSARLERGLTQEAVGEAVGLTGNAYGKIEDGKRCVSLDRLKPICDVLGIPMAEAFGAVAPLFTDGSGEDYDLGRELTVYVPPVEDSDPIWGFPDRGHRVRFTPEEMALHRAVAQFLGVEPDHPDALEASNKAIFFRRLRECERRLVEKETGNGDES